MRILAQVISFVFHPLLGCTYLAILCWNLLPEIFMPAIPVAAIHWFVLLVFFFTFLIPGLGILTLKVAGFLPSIQMRLRAHRPFAFLVIFVFYLAAAIIFGYRFDWALPWVKVMFILAGLIGVLLLITLRYKVSIHCALAGGLPGLILALMFHYPLADLLYPLAASFAIGGFVVSARLYLEAHDAEEAYWGSIIGFLLTFGPAWMLF